MATRTDYEARVLRSALLFPEDVLYKVVYSLSGEDFVNGEWRKLFTDMKSVLEKGKKNPLELMDTLKEMGNEVETVLNSWGGTYGAETIEEPIKTIKNRSRLARLSKLYQAGIDDVKKTETDADRHITQLMANLSAMYGSMEERTISDVVDSLKEHALNYVGKTMFGVPMGIPTMDDITKGMQPGHLMLLGGYTSMGKSWFALKAILQFLRQSKRSMYLSFEMGAEELLWRLAVMDLKDPEINLFSAKTRQGITEAKLNQLDRELELMRMYPLSIVDNLSLWDEVKLRILHEIHSKKAECIVVDYIQNIIVPKSSGEYESLNRIILDLQTLARKHRVFILALSQVNRESQKSKSSDVFGFKGSGNLENAADIAITINSVEDQPQQRQLIIGKNREGMTGQVTVDVEYAYGRIEQCPIQQIF